MHARRKYTLCTGESRVFSLFLHKGSDSVGVDGWRDRATGFIVDAGKERAGLLADAEKPIPAAKATAVIEFSLSPAAGCLAAA